MPLLTNVFHDLDPSPYLSDLLEAELGVEELQDDVEDSVQEGDQGHRDAVDGVGPHVHQVLGEGLDLVILSETFIDSLFAFQLTSLRYSFHLFLVLPLVK